MLIAIDSVALAQGTQPTKETPPPPGTQAGLVTVVNRVDGTIVIEPTKGGATAKSADATDAAAKAAAEKAAAEKVAAAEEASSEHFKIKRDLIDGVHAGDKVTFSVSDTDGAKTITKIEAN
jgi:hypothetical protein